MRPTSPRRFAWLGVAALGGLAGAVVYLALQGHAAHPDWDQMYFGARALLAGTDPYATTRHDHWPNLYPATAFLVAAPLAWLPYHVAVACWAGLSTAAFAWAMTRRGWWGLLALGSPPFLNGLLLGQWEPLLVGAAALRWLAFVWAAKPTVGAALLAAYPSRRAALLGGGLLAISLAVAPAWPGHWLAVLPAAIGRAPITRPFGWLLLLGLLRWRTPEGRLLAALALVPQTSMAYAMLPLFLVPRTGREMGALVLCSQVAFAVAWHLPGLDAANHLAALIDRQWPVWLIGLYLPALVLVLRPLADDAHPDRILVRGRGRSIEAPVGEPDAS